MKAELGPAFKVAGPAAHGRVELDYLVAVLRAAVEGRAAVPRPEMLDWAHLADVLRGHHTILPAILPWIDLDGAPAATAAALADTARGYRLRTGMLTLELTRVLRELEQAGCAPIVLKGPALTHTVYGQLPRYFTDLDILVAAGKRDRAGALLQACGYRFNPSLTAPPFLYEQHHFHHVFVNESGMTVELHWDLSVPGGYPRFDLAAWRERSRVIRVQGAPMRVPADGDQLLHAAKQCLDSAFDDLRRVMDAALLIRAGAADERDLAARARASGLATALWLLLRLSRTIAGVPAHDLEAALAPPGAVRACIASLELDRKCLELYVYRRSGIAQLICWLCAPDAAAAGRELRTHFVPRGWALAANGIDPAQRPGLRFYAGLFPGRLRSFCKIVAYQGWCLVRSALRGTASPAS